MNKNIIMEGREMAQCSRALAAPAEGLGFIPSTHVVALNRPNCSSRRSNALFQPPGTPSTHMAHIYACKKMHAYKIK